MPKKYTVLLIALIFGFGLLFASCAGIQVKPTAANFKAPKIAIEMIEVPQYDGYWYYGANIKPTKGKAGNHGAPLSLIITFNITNSNPYPILLEDYSFVIAFEDFDMTTVKGYESQWIPAGKTNQVKAPTMFTTRSALLKLGVTSGYKLKAKGMNMWQVMEKYWTQIPDMSFPINFYEGNFGFSADGVSKAVPFKGTYPK